MITGIEGVGEAVTGGMIARAVEPEAGEDGHTHEGQCLNCGAELNGPYCHQCGQKSHVHRTLTAFWHDIAHSVLHFEGKIWRTLPMLAWRPGELTRRYIHGERAKFVSPVALFLFSVFLMFAVLSLVGPPMGRNEGDTASADARSDLIREYNESRAERRGALNALRTGRERQAAAGRSTAGTDAEIRRLEAQLQLEERLFRQTMNVVASPSASPWGPPADEDRLQLKVSERPTNVDFINRGIAKARENPALLAYKLQNNAYKFSWALIPISVPFVWLLFLHRRRYRQYKAYDHTVFVTYSIAFMSLGFILLSLLQPLNIGEAIIGLAILFVPPVHMYRQLRGAYLLSRFSAIWRTAALIFFAFVAGMLFFMLLLALGALG